jgi:hypothetical protein
VTPMEEMGNADPEKVFLGNPCDWGHIGIRYKLTGRCVPCNREAVKDWQRRNKRNEGDGIGEDYVKGKLRRTASKARQRGHEYAITVGDLGPVPQSCPILNIPLQINGRSGPRDNSPSIDRIDSQKGYVPGNVAWMSYRANRLKNDGTADEHRRIADWMEKNS